MLIVLLIAPEMNGWAAASMRRCPMWWIDREPLAGLKAQSNTARCSSARCGAPSIVSWSSMYSTICWISDFS